MIYQITPMQPADWSAVREIYGDGIVTGQATFETQLPDWEKWDSSHRQDCRLIARQGDKILGWGRTQPCLWPASLLRSCGGFRLRCRRRARPRSRPGVAESFDRRIRALWCVDPPSRNFPRQRRQYRSPQILWVPRSWEKATDRETGRDVEGCAAAGATKHGSRHLGRARGHSLLGTSNYFAGTQ